MANTQPSCALILIISEDDDITNTLGDVLIKSGVPENDLMASGAQEILDCPLNAPPRAVIIDISKVDETILVHLKQIKERFKDTSIVCIGIPAVGTVLATLMQTGFQNFLPFPPPAESLAKWVNPPEVAPTVIAAGNQLPAEPCDIVTLFSPKGGSGVSLFTANIGVILAQRNPEKVIACDFGSQCGDISTYLDLTPEYTIRDLVDRQEHLDSSFMEGVVSKHKSGLHVLVGPDLEQEPLSTRNLKEIKAMLRVLKTMYRYILIDPGRAEPGLTDLVLLESNLIFLIGNLDIPSLKGLSSVYKRLTNSDCDPDAVKIVINRFNAKNQLSLAEFEKNINTSIACQVPNNYPLCIECINAGKSMSELDANAEITHKMQELSELVFNPGGPNADAAPTGESAKSIAQRLSQLIRGKGGSS